MDFRSTLKSIDEKTLLEWIRPSRFYGQFNNWGYVEKANNRVSITFLSKDKSMSVTYAETDSGQFFVYMQMAGHAGRQEYKQFKRFRDVLPYLKERYGINLSGYKTEQRDKGLDKWVWKGTKDLKI